jgi:type VI secretion system protein ImpB
MATKNRNAGSVAPKERINISYRPATGGAKESVELPLKMLVLGDFTNQQDDTPVEDLEPVNINSGNFDEVMAQCNLSLNFSVDNRMVEDEGQTIDINLSVNKLSDFEPDNLVSSVPELQKILQLREALKALKGPLGNSPHMRRALQQMLEDEGMTSKLKGELGLH